MIRTFRHKGLKQYFESGKASKINAEHINKVRLILTMLNASREPRDMNFPGSGLHQLKGGLKGFWSVKVGGNWRIIFKFQQNDVYEVDYIDYH